jgi:hypothetical protein
MANWARSRQELQPTRARLATQCLEWTQLGACILILFKFIRLFNFLKVFKRRVEPTTPAMSPVGLPDAARTGKGLN